MIDFHHFHINLIDVQEKQKAEAEHLKDVMFTKSTNAFTYIEDGEVKACIGLNVLWGDYANVWALIGHIDSWVRFYRETREHLNRHIDELNLKRVELTTSFDEADRFAQLLGFSFVADLPYYGVNGETNKLWVKYGGNNSSASSRGIECD